MIGRKLAHYEIRSRLGSGGMGDVYLAWDRVLEREVALKVLPEELSSDHSLLRRLQREARALAALDHPNIVTIFSVEEDEGVHFLTMARVEGQTLAELIPVDGLPRKRLLELAVELTDAIAAAHERGIVHRDLKPANAMIDSRGHLRVLDFGLAKRRPLQSTRDATLVPAETMTREGAVLGTFPYMSPEQLRGESVDHQSDLFSLGVMLYEMATGARPFQGETEAALIFAILGNEPQPIDRVRPEAADVGKIVTHCLAKKRQDRYGSAEEVLADLEAIRDGGDATPARVALQAAASVKRADSDMGAPTAHPAPASANVAREDDARNIGAVALDSPTVVPRRRGLWLSVAAALASVAIAIYLILRPGEQTSSGPPSIQGYEQLTSQPGAEQYPRISRDGKWVVYSAESAGSHDIYLQRVNGQTAINLTEDSGSDDTQPAVSADGEAIAFRSSRDGGGLFVMGPTGEAVRRITRYGFNPTWSSDNRQIAFATEAVTLNPLNWDGRSQLLTVDLATGEERVIEAKDGTQPAWSPDGTRIAFTARWREPTQMDIYTVAATGGKSLPVTTDEATDWSPAWSPDGRHIYFASDRSGSMNLWRVRVDPGSGAVLGELEPITTPATYLAHASISGDGSLVAYNTVSMTQNVEAMTLDPNGGSPIEAPRQVTSGTLLWSSPDPSPDGEWVVFYSRRNPEGNLWVSRTDGTGLRQLTAESTLDRVPRWSPDGRWVLFFSNRSGSLQLWKIRPDGSGLLQLTDAAGSVSLAAWSPDGTRIAARVGQTIQIFDAAVPAGAQEPVVLPEPPPSIARFVVMSWSPDGATLAGQNDNPGRGIVTYSFMTGEYEHLTDFGEWPVWLSDNQRILFVADGSAYFTVDLDTGETREIFSSASDVLGPPRKSATGNEVFFTRRRTGADVWLLTLS
jgi:Tol biopolymer transport system component